MNTMNFSPSRHAFFGLTEIAQQLGSSTLFCAETGSEKGANFSAL